MLYRLITLVAIGLTLILLSCKEDTIVIKGLSSDCLKRNIDLTIGTDTLTEYKFKITTGGLFVADSIFVRQYNWKRTCRVIGEMCTEDSASFEIFYTDTSDAGGLKVNARKKGTVVSGEILYCDNINNCNYIQIGYITGNYSNHPEGFFYSPLLNGWFRVYYN